MENKIQYRLIKKFGPSIFHVKIPEEIITKLNNYVDKVVQDKQKSKELDVGKNLVGDVTQEFVLEHNFIKESGWNNFLQLCVKQWIKLETNKEVKKFEIKTHGLSGNLKMNIILLIGMEDIFLEQVFLKVPEKYGITLSKRKKSCL